MKKKLNVFANIETVKYTYLVILTYIVESTKYQMP